MTNMFLNFFKKLFRSRNVSQLSFFALLFQQKMYESVVKENEGLKKELLKPQACSAAQLQPTVVSSETVDQTATIAQMYKDLYNRQWTDALAISQQHYYRKSQALQNCAMKTILTKVYIFCNEESEKQSREMEPVLTRTRASVNPPVLLPETVKRTFGYCRQLCVDTVLETLVQKFVLRPLPQTLEPFAKRVPEFVKECVRVCWWMVIHNPQLAFASEVDNMDFDRKLYSVYQTQGRKVRYVVWPAMISHDGNVVAKGFAECCRREETKI